jgi:ATP-dependent Clp protease ATP-binding subunit ClpX
MGFAAAGARPPGAEAGSRELLKFVEPEDLLSYGFIPEFIGRLPVVSVLDELTESQLAQILVEPKNSLVKQFRRLMLMEGVDLEFTPDALRELAAQALQKGTGARALRSLIEKLMLDVMFEVPGSRDIATITITRAVVRSEEKPLIRSRPTQAAA